jgi:hypothetical protein
MSSLLLDTVAWDLCVDVNHNIAVASAPYSYAQDAACAVKLFKGELVYDTSQGVPYFEKILGHWPSAGVLRAYLVQAALTATGVATAQVFFSSWENRKVEGVVNLTSESGQQAAAAFATPISPILSVA